VQSSRKLWVQLSAARARPAPVRSAPCLRGEKGFAARGGFFVLETSVRFSLGGKLRITTFVVSVARNQDGNAHRRNSIKLPAVQAGPQGPPIRPIRSCTAGNYPGCGARDYQLPVEKIRSMAKKY